MCRKEGGKERGKEGEREQRKGGREGGITKILATARTQLEKRCRFQEFKKNTVISKESTGEEIKISSSVSKAEPHGIPTFGSLMFI